MATKKAGSTAKKTTRSSQSKTTKVTAAPAKSAAASRPSLNLRNNALVGAGIGEFIGAFVLVTAFLVTKGEPLYLGFAAIAAVLLVATVSGAHINPVVTVGAWVTRRINHTKALVYVVAQLLGAAAAYTLLSHYLGGAQSPEGSVLTAAGREVFQVQALTNDNRWYVFFAEIVGASLFAFAVAGVWREKADRVAKAFTFGFGLFVAVLVAGVAASYVGANAVVNPAAALAASAVDFNNIDWFAVATYLGAPLVGGVVGFALRDVVETN